MGIIAADRKQSAMIAEGVIPSLQILIRSREKICEQEVRIAAVRPESIKEHHQLIHLPRVGKEIVNLNSVCLGFLPVLRFGWIRGDGQAAVALLLRSNLLRCLRTQRRRIWRTGDEQEPVAI